LGAKKGRKVAQGSGEGPRARCSCDPRRKRDRGDGGKRCLNSDNAAAARKRGGKAKRLTSLKASLTLTPTWIVEQREGERRRTKETPGARVANSPRA